MARRPPDRSVLEEIRKLRANLAPNHFQPLHNGLGIGRVRPTMPKGPAESPPPPAANAAVVNDALPPLPPEALPVPPMPKAARVVTDVVAPPPPTPSAPPARKNLRRNTHRPPSRILKVAYSWGIDAAMVVLTLLVGMMALELYAGAGRAALVAKNLPRTLPFMIVRELGPLRSLMGVAIVLVFYWLFFRVFAGGTPGEFLMGARGAGKTKEA